jgi:aspartyl aminopeptidase
MSAENHSDSAAGLMRFLSGSPTALWAVDRVASSLKDAGFVSLDESAPWAMRPGQRFMVVRGGGSLIAGIAGLSAVEDSGFRIVSAHTDFPGFRVKPEPELKREGVTLISAEVYGGPIIATWFDRDLSFAGTLVIEKDGRLERRLFRFTEPLCRMSSAAIHLDRDVNTKGFLPNPEEHTPVMLSTSGDGIERLLRMACDSIGEDAGALRGWSIEIWDPQPATLCGLSGDFLCSGRIDNLAMCHASMEAMLSGADDRSEHTRLIALFNSEEVGSATYNGAASPFLQSVMERLAGGREEHFRSVARSMQVSVDGAHAVHPNYPGKHDPGSRPVLNGGPVVKVNASERYTSSDVTAAYFRACAMEAGVKVQHFASRNDIPCGSTIGPVTAARLGLRSVDAGSPMLSMHSIREVAGVSDHAGMIAILEKHLQGGVPIPF